MSPSKQRQTADGIVAAFNRMDIDSILSARSESCLREFYPASLKFPSQNNDQYRANLTKFASVFQNFELTVHDVIEDLPNRKLCMWAKARADTLAGEYVNEYVWSMEFDESGEKVVTWKEFVDAVMAKEFLPKLVAEIAKKRTGSQPAA